MNEKEIYDLINKRFGDFEKILFSLVKSSVYKELSTNSQQTLGQWLDEWMQVYKVPVLKPSSLESIKICINKHIPEDIKTKALYMLNAEMIQKALNKIESSRMKKYTYDVYCEALKKAHKLKYIPELIMENVDSVKHERKQGKALSLNEQNAFLNKIEHLPLKSLFVFYLLSGCRRAEALTIKWADIDYENDVIYINGTKTEKSERVIPLFPAIKELLSSLTQTEEYIFDYNERYISRTFHKLCPNHRLHDLRHTFATRCLESGISIKVVQVWLGHSKLDTTANIYTHVMTGFEKSEAKKFNLTPLY